MSHNRKSKSSLPRRGDARWPSQLGAADIGFPATAVVTDWFPRIAARRRVRACLTNVSGVVPEA